MSIQEFFPFLPDYMTWEDWNGNLILYYGQEPIPYSQEADWKITANNVAQLPTFVSYPVPLPDRYDNWQEWAREFTLIINGPSK